LEAGKKPLPIKANLAKARDAKPRIYGQDVYDRRVTEEEFFVPARHTAEAGFYFLSKHRSAIGHSTGQTSVNRLEGGNRFNQQRDRLKKLTHIKI